MKEDHNDSPSTRREFLKKVCKTAGYAVPLVVAFQFGSIDAWADGYGRSFSAQSKNCNNLVEQIFNTSCW